MQFSIEKTSELIGKSVKTIYRHMAQNGLRYSVDENGARKLALEEIQAFYNITIDNSIDDSQMRFSNENDIENKLDSLINAVNSLSVLMAENNEIAKRQLDSQLDSQLRIDKVENIRTAKTNKKEPEIMKSGSSYLYNLSFVKK